VSPWCAGTGNGVPIPAAWGRRDADGASDGAGCYFGKYFLFNAQATENCGSTTLAM
jgi:hypothetical protein